jgi:hypothetical protein
VTVTGQLPTAEPTFQVQDLWPEALALPEASALPLPEDLELVTMEQ